VEYVTPENLTPVLVKEQFGLAKIKELSGSVNSPDDVEKTEAGQFIKAIMDTSKGEVLQIAYETAIRMKKDQEDAVTTIMATNLVWAYMGYCLARAQGMEKEFNDIT
jgi:hypothetical protein